MPIRPEPVAVNRNTIIILGVNAVFVFGALAIAFFGTGGFGGADPMPAPGDMPTGGFVLALSWEPAFCETQPRLPECREQTPDSPDASRFSLHGLWPEGSYCGVDADLRAADERHDWQALPEVELSEQARAALDRAMPGTRSLLDRHEWIKHGTCANVDMETYYAASVALTDAVNASSLPTLFVANLGRSLSAVAVAKALDADFGAGTGARMSLECITDGSRRLVSGLRIGLSGAIGNEPDLGALAAGAAPRGADCKSGVIDPAGPQ